MAIKTYRAIGTVLSLNLYINGKNYRVSFSPVSNYISGTGGSAYKTSDEKIQKALESRPDFGIAFHLVKNGSLNEDITSAIEDNEKKEAETNELKEVHVDCLEDAKLWLLDNCEWKPSARPTKASVQRVAATFGVKFVGL